MVEPSIPNLLQFGALGVLAIAFLTLLGLYVRSDKRNQRYADRLEDISFDRKTLIEIVKANTAASSDLANQIAGMNSSQERMANVISNLGDRINEAARH
jgi:hypothetical protein